MREIERDMKPQGRGLLSMGRSLETVGSLTGRILDDLTQGLQDTDAESEAYWRGLGQMYGFLSTREESIIYGGSAFRYDDLSEKDCIIAIMHSNACNGRGIDPMASRVYLLYPGSRDFEVYMFESPWGPWNCSKCLNIARYKSIEEVQGAFSVFRLLGAPYHVDFNHVETGGPMLYFAENRSYTRFHILPEDPARDFIDRLMGRLNKLIALGGPEPCW